jgi:1,4-alpha-glucan branching enzyme
MERVGLELLKGYNGIKKPVVTGQKSSTSEQLFTGQLTKPDLASLQATYLSKQSAVSFGRKLEEHFSWGANVNQNGKVSFKIWAPYAQKVSLEVRSKDNPPVKDHTKEEIDTIVSQYRSDNKFENHKLDEIRKNDWAYYYGKAENANHTSELANKGDGVYEITIDTAKPGDMYRFVLHKNINGKEVKVPIKDPVSKSQPFDTHGWSEIIDDSFNWGRSEEKWQKQFREKRLKDPNAPYGSLMPPSDLVVEQIHIGTYTNKGTYEALLKKIDDIAKDPRQNAIHILPVGEFYGEHDWGYDEVDLFAPESGYLGDKNKNNAPGILKQIVKKAHEKGVMCIMDVVYNHWGPNFTVVQEAGPYFCTDPHKTNGWGAGFNFEDKNGGQQVRDFAVDNALTWLLKYNFDGLRLDMTKYMHSDLAIKDIAFEVRKHKPEAVLIAEDARDKANLVRPINPKEMNPKDEGQVSRVEEILQKANYDGAQIGRILGQTGYLNEIGIDAQWNFGLCHSVRALVTGERVMGSHTYSPEKAIGNLANIFKSGYLWTSDKKNLPPTSTMMTYVMSHDEAGNNDGTRLMSKIMNARLRMFNIIKEKLHCDDKTAGQTSAQVTQSLLEAYVQGDNAKWNKIIKENNLGDSITKDLFGMVLEDAKALNKVSQGLTWFFPGPKMFLQGDLDGDVSTFKYFRDTPIEGLVEHISKNDKGYDVGLAAFKQSKIGQPGNQVKGIKEFNMAMADLFHNNIALKNGNNHFTNVLAAHEGNKLLSVHRYHKNEKGKTEGKEFFAVMNFGDIDFPEYGVETPNGKWKLIESSENSKYGGRGLENTPHTQEFSNNNYGHQVKIGLPKHSFLIYEKVS